MDIVWWGKKELELFVITASIWKRQEMSLHAKGTCLRAIEKRFFTRTKVVVLAPATKMATRPMEYLLLHLVLRRSPVLQLLQIPIFRWETSC